MGAWDCGPFDNDDALDLLGELADRPREEAAAGLWTVMAEIVDADGYAECPEMSGALAVACLVAARIDDSVLTNVNGREYLNQLSFEVDDELCLLAERVFTRAFEPADNEWYALWAEADGLARVEATHGPYRAVLSSHLRPGDNAKLF
ncbi:DUF4259 domain-containing protein [Actinomadura sp. HBU206391]|uniref:DUF4259 domain-containing protein n=1 Tax=Actinomadura sp. HBU206391 TaxID=2731692 RepID=UPI00165045C6|nr:DUF4259 domain-containing protein [Actinomadura sp. HBU206391]MBC6460225.1 DUF4259 domain-containing protein [Actinomadura sp. HBU206391]